MPDARERTQQPGFRAGLFYVKLLQGMRVLRPWMNVDWETSIMNVWEKKRNRSRRVPIFSKLRPYLEESWEQAEPGQEYVVTQWGHDVPQTYPLNSQ